MAQITVGGLGFRDGAVLAEIVECAAARGLGLCPLELGPHLRLQFLEQLEGRREQAEPRHQAPFGALTLISPRLTEDTDFPAGFYLRRIDGVLWLRGYTVDREHVWNPADHLVFVQTETVACTV